MTRAFFYSATRMFGGRTSEPLCIVLARITGIGILRPWFQALSIVGLLFIAGHASAAPSYVGDPVFRTDTANDYYKMPPFTSEASAIAGELQATARLWASIEGYGYSNPSLGSEYFSGWAEYNPVEGVPTSAIRKYSVHALSSGGTRVFNVGTLEVRRSTLVCPSYQRYNPRTGTCMDGVSKNEPGQNGANNGTSCPSCGQPINPSTGNMWHVIEDYKPVSKDGVAIVRTYNSTPWLWMTATTRGFGPRWNDRFNVVLKAEWTRSRNTDVKCWIFTNGDKLCPLPYIGPEQLAPPETITIQRGDGKRFTFNQTTTGYISDSNVNSKVLPTYNAAGTAVTAWTFIDDDGDATERFDKDGALISITNRNGTVLRLTYSDGSTNDSSVGRYPADAPICPGAQSGTVLPQRTLLCVTDSWGRKIQYRYDAKGRVIEILDPALQSYLYEYDGPSGGCTVDNATTPACSANNLTKVTYPDGKSQTYIYNEASKINNGANCGYPIAVAPIGNGFGQFLTNMTGLIDENGTRQITWTYNCDGLATSSQEADGINKVELTYSPPGLGGTRTATVVHTVGVAEAPQTTVRTYSTQFIFGVGKNTGIDQPCVECGAIRSRTYDENGNLASTTDFNGNVTTYIYDLVRNLETTRTEAFGTAQARTITTTWHPDYRLPMLVEEQGRSTAYSYDPAGNLVKKSVTANGRTRTWSYTYNSTGQMLTATAPRTDVVSTVQYTYDGSGNLSTVKNAAGHVTQLSNYDAHGRVGRIVDPNGLVTDLSYNPRGWLSSVSSGGETTSFAYDAVGQVTRITQPDGSAINQVYDSAHRLTAISDDVGNSIQYKLDLTGNRIGEEVIDPNGVLVRKTTRVFDVLDRLQKVTGAQQ